MRKNEIYTDYQLYWLELGAEAIAKRLKWAEVKAETGDPQELGTKQAQYDLRALKNLNK